MTVPYLDSVAEMVRDNVRRREHWHFKLAGLEAAAFAERARASSMDAARRFCQAKRIPFKERPGPLFQTGHQPVLFHPGVWIKNFLVDDLAAASAGTGLNLIVDTDAADDAGLDVPAWDGHALTMSRRQIVHAPGPDAPFESIDPPDAAHMTEVCRAITADLHTLPDKSASRTFSAFCDGLQVCERMSRSLGELLACARRAHEASSTSYLELPGSAQAQSDEFLLFFLDIAERIDAFRHLYNESLDEYRIGREIRSAANPFPNLAVDGPLTETPFWLMDPSGLRATLWLKQESDISLVCHADGCKVELARGQFEANIAALRDRGIQVRPKALVLTLFNRMFVSDLFVHGMGGAKYDRITDEIARRYYGVEPPSYLAATATMWLPAGVDTPPDNQLQELRHRIRTLEHNPEKMADDPLLDPSVRPQIAALAAEKAELVGKIEQAGANKKELGSRIRRINAGLGGLLRPVREAAEREAAAAERADASNRVARHRDFPFCYWSASEVSRLVADALSAADAGAGEE